MAKTNLLSQTPAILYNDRLFRIMGSLVAAHFITVFGDEASLFEILLSPYYYLALVCGTGIAYIVITTVRYVTILLDRKFDWMQQTLVRILMQVLMGWAIPSIVAFLLAAIYFASFGHNILHTLYIRIDFPVIVLLILVINLYYFCYYLVQHRQEQIQDKPELNPEAKSGKTIIIIHTPTKSIPIKLENICYVYILQGSTFIRTFDMAALQDSYLVNETLKEMEEMLDPRMFFRTNRQMIVQITAIVSFRQGKNQTLELTLTPTLHQEGADIPDSVSKLITVTEDRVSKFKKWIA